MEKEKTLKQMAKEAMERGEDYFVAPQLCKHGHVPLRRSNDASCNECWEQQRMNSPPQDLEKTKKVRYESRDKWGKANPEKYKFNLQRAMERRYARYRQETKERKKQKIAAELASKQLEIENEENIEPIQLKLIINKLGR